MTLEARYPDLAFFLQITPFEPFTLFQDERGVWNAKRGNQLLCDSHQKVDQWLKSLSLGNVQTLVICGLGLGRAYQVLKPWLQDDLTRCLVYLEDDLGALDATLGIAGNKALIEDPQVHLSVIVEPDHWRDVLEEVAVQFPEGGMVVTADPLFDQKKGEKFRLHLLRRVTETNAYFSEMLRAHELSENVLRNVRHLPNASYINAWRGAFAGVPALICGSGPSLEKDLDLIRTLETKALIIAGGSAITALTNHGIQPHLALAIDPNPQEHTLLAPACAFETPFLYGNRLRHTVLDVMHGPLGYMTTQTGGMCDAWFESQLGLQGEAIGPDFCSEAFSVTTLGISLAKALGCNPILLAGVDLAYTGNRRYVNAVAGHAGVEGKSAGEHVADTLIWRDDKEGNRVQTLMKWVMEAESISAYARENGEVSFVNTTCGGLQISGVPTVSLEKAISDYCPDQFDLCGKVHALLQRTKLTITQEQIQEGFIALKESLKRSQQLCESIVDELKEIEHSFGNLPSGKMTISQFDLEEEPIYATFLAVIGAALDKICLRRFPRVAFPSERACQWQQSHFRWSSFLEVLSKITQVVDSSSPRTL